jgi:hypothetical protein
MTKLVDLPVATDATGAVVYGVQGGSDKQFSAALLSGAGPAGPAGADGADGASAYDIWIAEGNSGTEADFLASLVGEQGPAGPAGADGADGEDGILAANTAGITDIWSGTQSAYDALTPDANTLYLITG